MRIEIERLCVSKTPKRFADLRRALTDLGQPGPWDRSRARRQSPPCPGGEGRLHCSNCPPARAPACTASSLARNLILVGGGGECRKCRERCGNASWWLRSASTCSNTTWSNTTGIALGLTYLRRNPKFQRTDCKLTNPYCTPQEHTCHRAWSWRHRSWAMRWLMPKALMCDCVSTCFFHLRGATQHFAFVHPAVQASWHRAQQGRVTDGEQTSSVRTKSRHASV